MTHLLNTYSDVFPEAQGSRGDYKNHTEIFIRCALRTPYALKVKGKVTRAKVGDGMREGREVGEREKLMPLLCS